MIYKYNGVGEKCPVPLVQLRLLLKKMQTGDQCIISIDDSGSVKDIPQLLIKLGYVFQKKAVGTKVIEISINACSTCEARLK